MPGTLITMKPTKLQIYPWGDGIADIRGFSANILMPNELDGMRDAHGYVPTAYDFAGAIRALDLTMQDAKPGVYFTSNPLHGSYGKWLMALKAAGWTQVPGCALNRVWGNWQAYKGPGSTNPFAKASLTGKSLSNRPWDSPDGFEKWIHAFYRVVPGREEPIKFDFSAATRNLEATNGDADLEGEKGSLWQVNYGGSEKIAKKYGRRWEAKKPVWCNNFARLSKNCGIALGHGLPECGPDLDEEFFTIAGLELDKKFPEDYSPFLEYGGMQFAHNLRKLSTAQAPCPHPLQVPAS